MKKQGRWMEEKKTVRDHMKHMRRDMPADDVARLSAQICEKLLSLEEIRCADNVLLYAAVRGEADLKPLVRAMEGTANRTTSAPPLTAAANRTMSDIPAVSNYRAPARSVKRHMALPRVCGDHMDFYEIRSDTELSAGAFGIPEPPSGAKKMVPPSGSVILVPGVAFMENGNRIGMGKGYYDRYLAQFPALIKIGIAYEAQMTAVWKPDVQDLAMDMIVTEHRVIRCRSSFT